MVKENYSFAIPLDPLQILKVSIKVLDKQAKNNEGSTLLNPIAPIDSAENDEIELSGLNELPENIIQAINSARLELTNRAFLQQSFMVATATGFQLLRLNQLIYFEYLTDKKQWTVFLTDQTQLALKRTTIAEDILRYSQNFIRINQQHIINLEYLVGIKGRSCQLSLLSGHEDKLTISRSYLKALQERIEVI
ncbi:MAG: LytTR family DNA-binding domain-containing protein [Bacteroidota bacterium]|nr:LytTR family DNA-binding domain-containing protein [Bacteroidota bacterium]